MPSHALFLTAALSLAASLTAGLALPSAALAANIAKDAKTKTAKGLNLKPPAPKEADDGSATHLLYETKAPEVKAGGLKVSSICTDALGMTHKKGDAGYVGCLRTQDRLQPDTGKAKRTNSVGISIGE